jgi:hypothetical protein
LFKLKNCSNPKIVRLEKSSYLKKNKILKMFKLGKNTYLKFVQTQKCSNPKKIKLEKV